MILELPFEPSLGHYRFGTVIDGRQYLMDVRWNSRTQGWYLDVLDENESPICVGIRIVLGALLGIRNTDPRWPNGVLYAADTSGAGVDATYDDLGTRVRVYFATPEEIDPDVLDGVESLADSDVDLSGGGG